MMSLSTNELKPFPEGTSLKSPTNALGSVPVRPPLVTTIEFTEPAPTGGAVAVIVFAFVTFTFVAATPLTVTVAGAWKSMPESVMLAPPAAGSEMGLTENTLRWENSDVSPAGSVAVAVTREPAGTPPATGKNALLTDALPPPSVFI
jgi:hypothetical protein